MSKGHHSTIGLRVSQDIIDRLDDLTLEKGYQFRSDLLLALVTTHPAFNKEPF